jgi:hypothetical protein
VSEDIGQSVPKVDVCDVLMNIICVYHVLVFSGMVEGCRRAMADSGGP